ncbi:hypothetical protein BM613_08070 [Sulfoacidibacillus thermotolerans]|uniref:Transposase n=1 Tax=Sulfoacidibacillus thermotolerans TaxID=1765684 RepID=A0A2U3D8F8_SULT2|nr:hypothetical protein BM613_08070 [Sulfoacidibacillus thermotolerans]
MVKYSQKTRNSDKNKCKRKEENKIRMYDKEFKHQSVKLFYEIGVAVASAKLGGSTHNTIDLTGTKQAVLLPLV